jgi:hypothetical protein
MAYVVGGVVASVLTALAGLHLYWAAGGHWGADANVPEVSGRPAFTPGPAACVVVAGLLLLAAATVLATMIGPAALPAWLPRTATFVVAFVFSARAVGDFRLVGFFKRVRDTRFARLDSTVYSPLCAALAAGCLTVALWC